MRAINIREHNNQNVCIQIYYHWNYYTKSRGGSHLENNDGKI